MEAKTKDQVLSELRALYNEYASRIAASKTQQELDTIRVEALGRKSSLTGILKQIKDLDANSKVAVGRDGNKIKAQLETQLTEKGSELKGKYLDQVDTTEAIDVTSPGELIRHGSIHPTTRMTTLSEDIFMTMGFEVWYPYSVDDDYHNFETLNLPPGHPARDSWDTFWTEDGQIAITHTSSMQNRILSTSTPPIRAIVPGRCFRNEATDARHEHTFTQIEGIYVDKGVAMTDMLGTLQEFFSKFFGQKINVKFTPDFFPFVEPGGMMSLSCILCKGKGCNVCKQTGWLEVLGCGMIHPKVLELAGLDPKTYSGFAWGFGVERLVMLKYDINDIRLFNSGNLEFLRQF